ncbi:MAG: MurR/RpiR family transcriptional regulator [Actinomyces ruminicola]|nr:MurR/RpiR family transcriptional regulator [Actinomyces ruminicola]
MLIVDQPEYGDHFSLKHFSLLNALLGAFNAAEVGSPGYALSKYLLEHFDDLPRLNVYEVAEECAISRSSIRRFCQAIGFETFTGVKAAAYEWQLHWRYFVDYANEPGFDAYLSAHIIRMLSEIRDAAASRGVHEFVEELHRAREVVCLASDFSSMSVREFQQAMLYGGKLIHVLTEGSGDPAVLDGVTSEDLIVVVSVTGNYAKAAFKQMQTLRALRVVLTTNRSAGLDRLFDRVIYLSQEDLEGHRSVYSKYGVSVFFDLVYSQYTRRYLASETVRCSLEPGWHPDDGVLD